MMLNCFLPHLGSNLVFFLWYLVMISCFYEAKETYKTLLGLKAAPANLFFFSADPNALKLQKLFPLPWQSASKSVFECFRVSMLVCCCFFEEEGVSCIGCIKKGA